MKRQAGRKRTTALVTDSASGAVAASGCLPPLALSVAGTAACLCLICPSVWPPFVRRSRKKAGLGIANHVCLGIAQA